jgi:hypothetical protein
MPPQPLEMAKLPPKTTEIDKVPLKVKKQIQGNHLYMKFINKETPKKLKVL